ncbi:leucine-rich_repeat domain-containing protein [Hexamita inflata]|uniref:Leucine-rich repeat domain-containing protein n=1 Tax=Hexamita inflata TaxID=28002 RepID=A0AA86PQ43_9EUKA|nr:leucine-rich repeat domain-containing protein [Hexamita inflata]
MTEYMTEQNQNALNEEYEAKMILKYAGKIKDSNLEIGNPYGGDSEVTNLRFLEKFDIQTLKLHIRNDMSVQLRSSLLKELSIFNEREYGQDKGRQKQRLNMQVDDLELENLEVLKLENNKLEDYQLYNLAKFKKLHSLDVSENKIDLTHIHSVTSLTKLSMASCELKNIDQITSLVNLKEFDLSGNIDLDVSPLYKLKSLTKLHMRQCELKNIDQIVQLTNLDVLEVSHNQLKNINQIYLLVNLKELGISQNSEIDITPLKNLVGLIKLNLSFCALTQLSALKPLINLQDLDISYNPNIIITELQYLKKLTHLNLEYCNLVSIYVLRPLVNLEELNISKNNIVYLDAHLNEMKKLQIFRVEKNLISDFKSIIKHPNYKNFDENCQKFLNKFNQTEPSKEEVRQAKQIIRIERQNLQFKQIPHKMHQTALNNFKQEINTTMNNACQSQIQFTANVVRIFQFLNQVGFE